MDRRSHRLAIWICLALIASGSTSATATERLRRAIHEIPGVPAGAADVAQDSAGYIWIAGEGGLARFDGVEARRWDPDTITGALEYLSTGLRGEVCAGNPQGDLYEVVGESARRVIGPDGEPLRRVRHAVYDTNGKLWIVLEGTIRSRSAIGAWSPPTALATERAWRLAPDHGGAVVAGTLEGGLWRLRAGETPAPIARVEESIVNRIVVEEDGAIVALARGHGAIRVRDGRSETLVEDAARPTGLASRDGVVWAVFTSGVYSIRDGSSSGPMETDEGFLGSGSVLVDRGGGLWLTSYRGIELYPEPDTVIWTEAADRERFRAVSVIPDAREGVWASTWNGPVFRRDGEAEWKSLDTAGWWTAHPGCLDADGRIWASAWKHDEKERYRTAVLRWDPERLSVLLERPGPNAIACDRSSDGTLWMAYGRELMRLDAGSDLPARVASIPSNYDRPGGVAVDAKLGLAAIYGTELCTAAQPTGSWNCTDLPDVGWLRDVAPGPDGRWWLATESSGVVVSGSDDRPLPGGAVRNPRVLALTRSPRGGLWVATGIDKMRVDRVAGETRVVERLTEWSGVPPWWSGGVLEQADGDLWLATAAGPLRVPGKARRESPPAPNPTMTGVTVDGRNVSPSQEVELSAGDHVVEARFSAFSYRDLESLRYRVRSAEGDWIPLSGPAFRWVAPSPGNHSVEVQVSVDGARWSTAPARFDFSVAPVWYATPWATTGGIAVVAMLLFLAYRLRVVHLLRLERQRIAIALDLHDEVGAAIGGIGVMAGVAADDHVSSNHRLVIARRIAEAAEEVGSSLYDIIWSLRVRDARLDQLAAQLTERGARLFPGETTRFETIIADDLPAVELSLAVQRNVQRIVAEALHNVARHASASRVALGFEKRREGCMVWVEDDGVGLSGVSGSAGSRLGLEGMRRRAREIGAWLDLGRGPMGGTRVELRFHADGSRWKTRPARVKVEPVPMPERGEA